MNEENVNITISRHQKLLNDEAMLDSLKYFNVEKWEKYQEALDMYNIIIKLVDMEEEFRI
jgi:hypothetical protein